jgi:hypothetical protein
LEIIQYIRKKNSIKAPKLWSAGQSPPLHYGDYITHPVASTEPGSRLFQTFRSHPQGALVMATLEHLTFSELEKLIRALALTEQEHLDNTRGLLGSW